MSPAGISGTARSGCVTCDARCGCSCSRNGGGPAAPRGGAAGGVPGVRQDPAARLARQGGRVQQVRPVRQVRRVPQGRSVQQARPVRQARPVQQVPQGRSDQQARPVRQVQQVPQGRSDQQARPVRQARPVQQVPQGRQVPQARPVPQVDRSGGCGRAGRSRGPCRPDRPRGSSGPGRRGRSGRHSGSNRSSRCPRSSRSSRSSRSNRSNRSNRAGRPTRSPRPSWPVRHGGPRRLRSGNHGSGSGHDQSEGRNRFLPRREGSARRRRDDGCTLRHEPDRVAAHGGEHGLASGRRAGGRWARRLDDDRLRDLRHSRGSRELSRAGPTPPDRSPRGAASGEDRHVRPLRRGWAVMTREHRDPRGARRDRWNVGPVPLPGHPARFGHLHALIPDRYDKGYPPRARGIERFGGEAVHPRFWSDELDYAEKRVVVIGSGRAVGHTRSVIATGEVLPTPSRPADPP